MLKSNFFIVSLILFLQACSSYEPISAENCEGVVTHATQVLGELSPSHEDLLKSCKSATDKIRGCIMAAESVKDMTLCE